MFAIHSSIFARGAFGIELLHMPLFGGSPGDRVTEYEFENKLESKLRSKGLKRREVDEVKQLYRLSVYEGRARDKGLDQEEIDHGIKWLKENPRSHRLREENIDHVKEVLEDLK